MAGTSFEITGSVKKIFDKQELANSFTKREFVLRTEEDYPQDIKFECIKERCSLLDKVKEGDRQRVQFNIRGREFNERYFVNLQAWRMTPAEGGEMAAPRAGTASEMVGTLNDADLVEIDGPDPF